MTALNASAPAILVTGGAGFIGSHLCERLLAAGRHVITIDNFNDYYDPALKRENAEILRSADPGGMFELIEGDLRDNALIRKLFSEHNIGQVIHLAAMAGVRASISRPDLYFDVNINGTMNLLEAAVNNGKPSFVFASSSSVYGGSPTIPFTESDPVNYPVSPYAASKKAGELLCHTYHHLHGLDITCLRFFTVYGPRQRPEMAIHLFSEKIVSGKPLPMFGDGSTSRDYTYIDDIVDGILATANNMGGYRIYNLGNNTPVKLKDLIDALASVLNEKAIIEQQPIPPGDVLRTWADISLAQDEIGYKPSLDLEEGLRRFGSWFMNRR